MPTWATNWKAQTLAAAGIASSPKAVKALSAWAQSTPTDPWTNNPLGMPASLARTAKVPGSQYAMFPSISAFYAAFGKWAKTSQGQAIVSEIQSSNGYGPLWRLINDLHWPGWQTETDYPAKMLDLASESYRESVNAAPAGQRKTSGVTRAPAAVHDAMRAQAASLHQAATAFGNSTKAVQYLIRKHASNG